MVQAEGNGIRARNCGFSLTTRDRGTEPLWSRVATARVFVNEVPPLTVFRLQPSATGIAAYARGGISWSAVQLDEFTHGQATVPDVNGDGFVTMDDTAAFAAVLTGQESDAGYVLRSDANGDQSVNGRDIPFFVELMLP